MEGYEGVFGVAMVATQEGDSEQEVRGTMVLTPHDDGDSILIGWSDLDVTVLGAYDIGGLLSRDPAKPGIRVFEDRTSGVPSILFRLGADANQEGILRFDGARTVLFVHRIEDDAFFGRWESGIAETDASGHFCAVAEADRP